MSLFHHHHEDVERPEDAESFEVLGSDGVVRRYAREQFDLIFATTDPEEVQRQVDVGWVILDERQVEAPGRERPGASPRARTSSSVSRACTSAASWIMDRARR